MSRLRGENSPSRCTSMKRGCETVARSHYSHLAGINVAVFGIGGYVLLLAAAAVPGDVGRFGGFSASLIGFGFSAYLTYRELFSIHAICEWCASSAVIMTVLAGLSTWRFLRGDTERASPGSAPSGGHGEPAAPLGSALLSTSVHPKRP